jgi:hypothetical protein
MSDDMRRARALCVELADLSTGLLNWKRLRLVQFLLKTGTYDFWICLMENAGTMKRGALGEAVWLGGTGAEKLLSPRLEMDAI